MSRALMLQGLASGVGKSVLVAGLCRLLARRGVRVAPFKPQNMSNNAAAAQGGEIGRAQALQALACGLAPDVRMNPVLIKPETDGIAELVVLGRPRGKLVARRFREDRRPLRSVVLDAFHALAAEYEAVIVEGAGSPAEPNLMDDDIANMGFAQALGLPVWLVGDIDRGGVFAHFLGTMATLPRAARALITGFVINKFRGEKALLDEAIGWLERRTRRPVIGVVPYLDLNLPEEDAPYRLARLTPKETAHLRIAAVCYPRAANLDDLEPLAAQEGIALVLARAPEEVACADVVILPGSKHVGGDLAWLRAHGLDAAIRHAHAKGAHILGICGGMQMLGLCIRDPLGLEGGDAEGLGLLPITSTLAPEKIVRRVEGMAQWPVAAPVRGFEIHRGRCEGVMAPFPFAAASDDGRGRGSWVHHLFHAGRFRAALLAHWGHPAPDATDHEARVLASLDRLADALEAQLDLAHLPWR